MTNNIMCMITLKKAVEWVKENTYEGNDSHSCAEYRGACEGLDNLVKYFDKIKIPTSTFKEIQLELADWLMSAEVGHDTYITMLEPLDEDGTLLRDNNEDDVWQSNVLSLEQRYTDEGQDIFIKKYEDVEAFLNKYFKAKDTNDLDRELSNDVMSQLME